MKRSIYLALAGAAIAAGASLASADSLPVTPPGTQVLWLAADFGTSVNGMNQLTAWDDASGNNHNWLGGTGSNVGSVATLTTDPTNSNQTNNPKVISFPGIFNDGIILDHTGNLLSLTTFSVYIVANTTAGAGASQDFLSNYNQFTGQGYAIGTADNDPTNAKFYTGAAGSNINATNNSFAGKKYNFVAATINSAGDKSLTTAAYGANSSTFSLSGTDNSTLGGAEYVLGNLNGGTQALLGNIAEVLVYDDTGLSAAQISQQQTDVGNYLDAKYFSVPEPASLSLLGIATLGLIARRRKI